MSKLDHAAKRLAIAIEQGWTNINPTGEQPVGFDPDLVRQGEHAVNCVRALPDYFNDLNAVARLEKTLSREQRRAYLLELAKPATMPQEIYYDEAFEHVTADACRRAEAYGRVKGLWK